MAPPRFLFLFCLMTIVTQALALLQPISKIDLLSRQKFLLASLSLPAGWNLLSKSSNTTNDNELDVVEIPLTFLPRGGCLAVKVSLNDRTYSQRIFGYYAIVDTGSPFLTAPPEISRYSRDESQRLPPTQEQYGEAVGSMQWRSVLNVEILTSKYDAPLTLPKLIAGLPESNVVDDTGGIFLGLIWRDDQRPSFLQQCGYTSFILDYPQRQLTLSRRSTTMEQAEATEEDSRLLQLFDFSPYGKDLYHYGVPCQSFTLVLSGNKTIPIMSLSLKRPVIAVIDSGLTGCIFSDSLRDELLDGGHVGSSNLEQVQGLQVSLPTLGSGAAALILSSSPKYWSLSRFKLPWFDDDATHPHVIAMGATFLSKARISIDPLDGKAKIET